MRTIAASWLRAARTEPRRPVWIVVVRWGATGVEGTDQLTFASKTGFGYPASVQAVSSIPLGIDPITRAPMISRSTVTLRRDLAVRRLVEGRRLRNRHLVIKLGFEGIDVADFVTLATLRIRDYPSSEHEVRISGETLSSALSDSKTNQTFTNRHPAKAISMLFSSRGVPTSLLDLPSFDYDANERVAHWNLSKHRDQGTEWWKPLRGQTFEEKTIRELVGEICTLTGYTLVENANGVISLSRYDQAAAPVRHFYRRQIRALRVRSVVDELYNRFTVRFGRSDGDFKYSITLDDTDSQTNHAYADVDGSPFVSPLDLDTEWMNGAGLLEDPDVPLGQPNGLVPTSADFRVTYAGVGGFCGARFEPGNLTQPTDANPTVDRPVYLMLTGENCRVDYAGGNWDNPTKPEIIRASAIAVESVSGSPDTIIAPDYLTYPRFIRYTIDATATNGGRAQFESTPLVPARWAVGRTIVTDVTMAVDWIQRSMTRTANGAAEIEIDVGLEELEIAQADLVTLDDDVYLDFAVDGASSAVVWEVASVEVWEDGDGITLVLRKVRDDSTAAPTVEVVPTQTGITPFGPLGWSEIVTTNAGEAVVTDDAETITR